MEKNIGIIILMLVVIGIRIVYGIKKNKNSKDIKFDEFDDVEKIKAQEIKEKQQLQHEADVLETVYKDSYKRAVRANKESLGGNSIIGDVAAHFEAVKDIEKAKKDLYNFKVLDSVEVEEDKLTEGHQINNLRENGNNFDVELFKKWSRQIFGCIKAGNEEQLKVVQNFMSEELYGRFQRQVKQFEKDGLEFVTEDILIEKCNLYDYSRSMSKEEIKILITASMKEYILQKSTNAVLRGNKDKDYKKSVIMTFQKQNIAETEGMIHNCPNCGAEVQQTEFGKCPYCNTLIIPIRYNWTLIKFETI